MKLAAVEVYCSGQQGLTATALLHNVGASSLRKWVAAYQAQGPLGFGSSDERSTTDTNDYLQRDETRRRHGHGWRVDRVGGDIAACRFAGRTGIFRRIPPKYLDLVAGVMVMGYGIYFLMEVLKT